MNIYDLRDAIGEIENKQNDMALRWVMLKMWLDRQEKIQVDKTCDDCKLQYTSSCPSLLGKRCRYFQSRPADRGVTDT